MLGGQERIAVPIVAAKLERDLIAVDERAKIGLVCDQVNGVETRAKLHQVIGDD
jgi:hypothetical protein